MSPMSPCSVLTGNVGALKNEAALRDHCSFGVSWGSPETLIGWEREALSCSEALWAQTLRAELVTKTPTNRLEVVRGVNKELSHGWRIPFLFPLLLCELSLIPLAFTIMVCFPFSEISSSSPGVPCTAHPITSFLASPLRKLISLLLGSTIFLQLLLCTWFCLNSFEPAEFK